MLLNQYLNKIVLIYYTSLSLSEADVNSEFEVLSQPSSSRSLRSLLSDPQRDIDTIIVDAADDDFITKNVYLQSLELTINGNQTHKITRVLKIHV